MKQSRKERIKMKTKRSRHDRTNRSPRSIVRETLEVFAEATKLFPRQDPIRLAAGILDFKMPLKCTMFVLRRLAPQFKGENADMIRLAAGFNDMKKHLRTRRLNRIARAMRKADKAAASKTWAKDHAMQP